MRALTIRQPWAGLMAAGIKRVENRPRAMIKADDFGKPFGLHASREIAAAAEVRIAELAPDLLTIARNIDGGMDRFYRKDWHALSQIMSAVIAVATIRDALYIGGNSEATTLRMLERLGIPEQLRFTFGPTVYVLAGPPIVLPAPVPCRGWQGFWTLQGDVAARVEAQLA